MVQNQGKRDERLRRRIRGSNRAISTSKIRKITAIKKNRREKGNRDELLGSNPHSKGELFSRSVISFLDNREAKIITKVATEIKSTVITLIEYNIYSEVQTSWLEAKYTNILNK